ncbi:hypothetical protein BV22DRAFT_977184, partial [Leucogyrophana mollusca]
LREIEVLVNRVKTELGLLDEGSEIVVIREDAWRESQAAINECMRMMMQTANGAFQETKGCLEMLEIDVDGLKKWAHAYVVPDAPYRLLLGQPWQQLVRIAKDTDNDGIFVMIRDP